jgi:DNA-binding response OmpR family regulator
MIISPKPFEFKELLARIRTLPNANPNPATIAICE